MQLRIEVWVEEVLCKVSELPGEGEAREFECSGGRMVCVAKVKGEILAMDNVCVHRGGPLGQGMIEHGKIVCPWHGWAYDPKSGAATHNPSARVKVYPVRIVGDEVRVDLE
jgi:nitrite reductase (NADH) small subunit